MSKKGPQAEEQQQFGAGNSQEQKVKLNPLLTQAEFEKLKKIERRHIVFNGPKQKKRVALTFDDGPDPRFTTQILNILRENNIKATFFLIGKNVQRFPHLVKQEVDEGHAIGSHSWEHKELPKLTPQQLHEDLKKTKEEIKKASGKDILFLRPPYGATKGIEEKLKKEGYVIINWDVDTVDWKPGRTPQQIVDVIQKETQPGSIILFHDAGGNRSATVSVLPQVIQQLKSKGFEFVTVDQLLEVRAYHN